MFVLLQVHTVYVLMRLISGTFYSVMFLLHLPRWVLNSFRMLLFLVPVTMLLFAFHLCCWLFHEVCKYATGISLCSHFLGKIGRLQLIFQGCFVFLKFSLVYWVLTWLHRWLFVCCYPCQCVRLQSGMEASLIRMGKSNFYVKCLSIVSVPQLSSHAKYLRISFRLRPYLDFLWNHWYGLGKGWSEQVSKGRWQPTYSFEQSKQIKFWLNWCQLRVCPRVWQTASASCLCHFFSILCRFSPAPCWHCSSSLCMVRTDMYLQ